MATNIGLYIRVSTDRQARIDEGSLKSQKQRLEEWVSFSNKVHEKDFVVHHVYQDVESGTTAHRPDYQKMLQDIRTGRLRAVAAISISRLNRSLRDFYELQDLCEKHNVAIVSLKENFDTSTAIGRALLKFMLVFYELESEQTGERVSDNKLARASRGLWTGSRVFGYNPVVGKKGYLEPDPIHSKTVEYIFDTYLSTGSIGIVRSMLKEKGFRTAAYTTEKGRLRKPQDFADETIRRILTNKAYIGKNEIGKSRKSLDQTRLPENKRYRIVDGLWTAIIDEDKFSQVQEILGRNYSARGNVVAAKKKNFLLAGIMICGECSSSSKDVQVKMLTGSGTSKTGKSHYYYLCPKCKKRIPAGMIEDVVQIKLGALAQDTKKLRTITDEANRIVTEDLPRLRDQLSELHAIRREKSNEVDRLYQDVRNLDASKMKDILQSKGEAVAREIEEIEKRIQLKEAEIASKNGEKVDFQLVKETLNNFKQIFAELTPYEQQQILQHLIDNVTHFEQEIRIAFDSDVYIEPIRKGTQRVFSKSPDRRGRRDSNSRPPA